MLDVIVTLVGERPLIVKSERGVNQLDPFVRDLAKITGKTKKTEEDHELIARMQFELGLYWRADMGPFMPTANVQKSFVQGARLSKMGKYIEQGTFPLEVGVPILYDGPREIEEMYQDYDYRYTVSVGIGRKRIMCTRPRFNKWAIEVPFAIDLEKIDLDVFTQQAEMAGRYIGLGERRPGMGGPFGVYSVSVEAGPRGAKSNGVAAVSAR